MCEKGVALDERIKSYRAISASVIDERASTALLKLIEECKAAKLALHLPTEPGT
jgi:hypothetical protein